MVMSNRMRLLVTFVGAVAAAYFFGYWFAQRDPSDVRVTTEAIYVGIAATGLNVLTGYNGQVSIGHGAFFGLGAYTSAILVTEHGWHLVPTIPVSMALCFVVGAAIGFPALRVKGLYLALVTLGLAVLFPDLTDRFVNGTGGTNLVTLRGTEVAVPDWYVWFPDPIADFFDEWISAPDQWAYYLTLVLGLVLLAVVFFMARSRFGRSLIAVRDHEAAAETVGIDLSRVKVTAFAFERALRRDRRVTLRVGHAGRRRSQGRDVPDLDRIPRRGRDRRRGHGVRPDAGRVHRRLPADR